jgi:predicted PurR-regulated permease PerM
MFSDRLQNIGFFILLGAAALVAAFLFWPFFQLLALAGILAVLFRPWYLHFEKSLKSEGLAAFFTVILVLVIVLVPLLIIGYALYAEIVNFLSNGSFTLEKQTIVQNLPAALQGIGQNFLTDLSGRLSALAGSTVQGIAGVISNVANFFLAIFLVFFTLYYFLKDGDKIQKFVAGIFPLSQAHETKLVDDLESAISGVVKGSFLVALIQGVVATIGFLIFGVTQPFLWGAFTVLAALVPTFGTSLSLIPAILYLLLTGHTGAAIGMAIWGFAAVGLIDNFIGPKLVGRQAKLHPLLVLFAVLGGIQFFGMLGFLLGPIAMAVFMTLINIYQAEARQ